MELFNFAKLPSQFHPLDNETEPITSEFRHKYPHISIPYISIIVVASFTGTLGNTMVIGAVLSNKSLKTVGNNFILNLAIGDICVSGFVDPFSIIGIVKGESFFYGVPWLCEIVGCVCFTSCFCSLLSIGAISFNRYIHICHYDRYDRIYTRRNGIVMCLGIWIFAFILQVTCLADAWGDHVYDRKTLSCVWDRTAHFSYTLTIASVGVALPLTLITICYVLIYVHVLKSKSKFRNAPESRMQKKERIESIKLARTLFIIFIVFAVCWTPYGITIVGDVNDTWQREIHIFSILLAHSNSSLNWIVYGVTNRQFRLGYLKFLNLFKFKCVPETRIIDNSIQSNTSMDRSAAQLGVQHPEIGTLLTPNLPRPAYNNDSTTPHCQNTIFPLPRETLSQNSAELITLSNHHSTKHKNSKKYTDISEV